MNENKELETKNTLTLTFSDDPDQHGKVHLNVTGEDVSLENVTMGIASLFGTLYEACKTDNKMFCTLVAGILYHFLETQNKTNTVSTEE